MSGNIESFDRAVDFLFSLSTTGIKLGLETISILNGEFKNPYDEFKSILVAGTNGKGSVCSMLSSILINSGYKTGLFTSPHLVDVRERIKINGEMIPEEDFVRLLKEIKVKADKLYSDGKLTQYPTYFEYITTIAFLWFRLNGVQIAVLEIGLGGRFDAVNVVDPVLSVITDIDLDHRKWLGDTLAKIAYEKAGVMRPSKTTVISVRKENARRRLYEAADEKKSDLVDALDEAGITEKKIELEELPENLRTGNSLRFEMESSVTSLDVETSENIYKNIIPALSGDYQQRNISAVIRAAEELRRQDFKINNSSIIEGISATKWPGRMEWYQWKVPVLFEGAHNPAGVRELARYLRKNLHGRKFDLMFAAKKKKNYIRMVERLFPMAENIWLIDMGKQGFIPNAKIKIRASSFKGTISECEGLESFVERYRISQKAEFLLCTGSLYLIGNFKALLEGKKRIP